MYTINKILKNSFLINRPFVREFKRPIIESDLDLKKINKLFEKYKKSIYDVENEKWVKNKVCQKNKTIEKFKNPLENKS
tara:strand:+ start:1039 stop:1275 length:237 start_codon:yes stop_codon:yes gene_type:complete